MSKVCAKCKLEKEREAFSKSAKSSDGLHLWCKGCDKAAAKERYYRNREHLLHGKKEYSKVNKERIQEYRKTYYQQNKEEFLAKGKMWRERNAERHRQNSRDWSRNNPERKKENDYTYQKGRMKTDPGYKLSRLLRTRLYNAIRYRRKTGSAVRDLGMPIDAFLTYLNLDALDKYGIPYTGNESKFHIDHVRPLASFNLEDAEQLKQAVHWSNLQVLRAEENLQKGAKYVQPTTSNPPTSAQREAPTP